VFTFLEQNLLSWPFLGQLSDFGLISLKETFLLLNYAVVRFFLQRKRASPVGSFITLIVAVSYSNESFLLF